MTKKLIDSCVLVYAYDKTDPGKHRTAKELVLQCVENSESVVSIQNLAEFSRIMAEKSKEKVPHHQVMGYVERICANYQVISYGPSTIGSALLLCASYKIHFFDALIAATMQENGIREIITENEKDFAGLPFIRAINPFKKT
jgi:predicted nucleic acid-binding protein